MSLLSFSTITNSFDTQISVVHEQLRNAHQVNIHHSCCALWNMNGFDLDTFVRKTTNIVHQGNALFFSNKRQHLVRFGIETIQYDPLKMVCTIILDDGRASDEYAFFLKDDAVFIHHKHWTVYY